MSDTFTIETKKIGKAYVFTTHGYINNLGGDIISAAFKQAVSENAKNFLFDLADSKIVNSIGVSVLIELLEETIEMKGTMAFCCCAPIVKKTFQIMGLTQYASIFDTLEEAVKSIS